MGEQPENTAKEYERKPKGLLSFVRRSSRLTPAQKNAMETIAKTYVLSVERETTPTSVALGQVQEPENWFGRKGRLIVEIGSGQGHQITSAAKEHPCDNFLGIEVFVGGIARTLVLAQQQKIENVRLVEANAPEVLTRLLPQHSVDECWIFFPDPWPKSKHHKRRLISDDFTPVLAHALKPGGVLRLATDWQEYAEQMREVLDRAAGFTRDFTGPWAERFQGRVLTAFERKGLQAGRTIFDLTYRRTETETEL